MAKPPSWNEIRSNASVFSARWAKDSKENAEAQTFWNEFLQVFGVDRKRVATFEKQAKRTSTNSRGRIDLLWPGTLVAEHKSAGLNLEEAEGQALDYLDDLTEEEVPAFVLSSDFRQIRLLNLNAAKLETTTIQVSDLAKEVDRFGFIAGYSQRDLEPIEEEAANIEAARLMASFYEALSADGYDGHEGNVLMMRLLFLLFGDDTGMWEKGLFSEFVDTRTQTDGSDLGPELILLFQTLNQPENKRSASLDELVGRFPYVNGGLFADAIAIPSFSPKLREALCDCSAFDWGAISPAIFGSLFQAVKTREARRELGEHYTTEKNILRVAGPLFLDELRDEFEDSKNQTRRLNALHARLGQMRFLDPACGCGNFLVVAYRELRRLEHDIILRLRELKGDDQLLTESTLELKCSLDQFFGIEIEDWPAQIAATAMFLVDHQLNLELAAKTGQAADRLPINIEATIRLGNALRTDWKKLLEPTDDVVVLGNPPFHGMYLMADEQQEDNRIAFSKLDVEGLRTGRLDYSAAWYAKAIDYLKGTNARAAFVSTNSITQGEQARTMQPVLNRTGFKIDFAHRTFKWTSEAPSAAAVHVVIIGFSAQERKVSRKLYDYLDIAGEPSEVPAKNINFYLIDGSGDVPQKRTRPLLAGLPIATQGNKPWDGGHLVVKRDDYAEVAADRIARQYLRKYFGARELLHNEDRWCLWLKDAPPSDLRSSDIIRKRLAEVRKVRLASKTARTREKAKTPYLFSEIRQPVGQFIAFPQTSSSDREYVPAALLEPEVVPSNALYVWSDAPLWLFGYLQSAAFMAWIRVFSGRLKNDFQIAPDLVYSTFPFIEPTGARLTKLEAATQAMMDARASHPDQSLADLYARDAMPEDLRVAHRAIDRVVDALYGFRKVPTEGERMGALYSTFERLSNP